MLDLHAATLRLRQHDLLVDTRLCADERAAASILRALAAHDRLPVTLPPVQCRTTR